MEIVKTVSGIKKGLLGVVAVATAAVIAASFWFWITPVGVNNYINKVSIQIATDSPELLTRLGLIDNTLLDFHSGRLADYTKEGDERSLEKTQKGTRRTRSLRPRGPRWARPLELENCGLAI